MVEVAMRCEDCVDLGPELVDRAEKPLGLVARVDDQRAVGARPAGDEAVLGDGPDREHTNVHTARVSANRMLVGTAKFACELGVLLKAVAASSGDSLRHGFGSRRRSGSGSTGSRSISSSRTSHRARSAPAKLSSAPSMSTRFSPARTPWPATFATVSWACAGTDASTASMFPDEDASTSWRGRSPTAVGVPAASSLTSPAPRPTKMAPQAAIPTATPTWRKVSLILDAIPLCSFGTTETATSAITGLSSPISRSGDQEAAEQRGPLVAGADA